MKPLALITGAGTGIGKAICLALLKRDCAILATGRRAEVLNSLKKESPERIFIVTSDVSTNSGRQTLLDALPAGYDLTYIVHNAGVITPVGPLSSLTEVAWRKHMAINAEAPLFLTQALMPHMKSGRILHISSGAAHFPIIHWTPYCTSKAALYMIYECLKLEFKQSNIHFGSIMPGIADTPMQDTIRTFSSVQFPDVKRFQNYKAKKELVSPDKVGEFIAHLLLDVSAEVYSEKEWDMYDHL